MQLTDYRIMTLTPIPQWESNLRGSCDPIRKPGRREEWRDIVVTSLDKIIPGKGGKCIVPVWQKGWRMKSLTIPSFHI